MKFNSDIKVVLTSQERHNKLESILANCQRARPKNARINHTEVEENFLIKFKNLTNNARREKQQELTDEVLLILDNNEHAKSALYEKLMQLLQNQMFFIEASQIANYLYNKRKFISVSVISCLMRFKNNINEPDVAIQYYDENIEKLPKEADKEQLHVNYIESLRIKNENELALNQCELWLAKLYNVEYDRQTKRFLLKSLNQELLAEDEYWRTQPNLNALCFNLALILDKIYPKSKHIIYILQHLRKISPNDPKLIIPLAKAYRKKGALSEAVNLYESYLLTNPEKIFVWTNYIILLIESNQHHYAREVAEMLLTYQAHTGRNLKKIKIIYAWFFAVAEEGKEIFNNLKQEFPEHPMIAYLAIRYAIKIHDEQWKQTLYEQTKRQFANRDRKLLQIIESLSQARMVCAIIENDYFSPTDLLQDRPKELCESREIQLPQIIQRAFQKILAWDCVKNQPNDYPRVFLIGSAVSTCMSWYEANKTNAGFDISPKLHDLDFVVLVPEIPEASSLSGFERSPYILNLFTYKGGKNEPDIDVRFYVTDQNSKDYSYDIANVIKGRDLTVNMLLLDAEGQVWDYTGGKAFADFDENILSTYDDPLICLSEDPLRILRVVTKLLEENIQNRPEIKIDPTLEKALYNITAPNWLAQERERKKIYKRLLSPNAVQFLALLQKYSLLGPAFGDSELQDEKLLIHCLSCVSAYCRENKKLHELDDLHQNLSAVCNEKSQYAELKHKHDELKQEYIQLAEKVKQIKKSIDITKKQRSKLNAEIDKKVKTQINIWKKETKQTLDSDLLMLRNTLNASNQQVKDSEDKHLTKEEKINKQVLIKTGKVKEDILNNFYNFFGNIPKCQEFSAQPDFNRKIAIQRWQWDIDEVSKALKYSCEPNFIAFLALYLGYYYLEENNLPIISCYFFSLTHKCLELNFDDKYQKNFMENHFKKLYFALLEKSKINLIPDDAIMEIIKSASKNPDSIHATYEALAYIECYFKFSHINKDDFLSFAKWLFIEDDFYLNAGDFLSYLSSYDIIIEEALFTESELNFIDSKIYKLVKSELEFSYDLLSLASHIKKIHAIQMFANVRERRALKQLYISSVNVTHLIKSSFANADANMPAHKFRIFMQLGDLYTNTECALYNMKAAEFFRHIINSCESKVDDQFGFYYLWAKAKLEKLEWMSETNMFLYKSEFEYLADLFENLTNLINSENSISNLKCEIQMQC